MRGIAVSARRAGVTALLLLSLGRRCDSHAGQAAASATADGANVTNMTLYHIIPRNYTGITNMDTGDAAGDVFFGLYEFSFPELCRADPTLVNCRNTPILNIPDFNVYIEYRVEADARLGQYAMCNPDPRTGVFACKDFSQNASQRCWYDNPVWKDSFAGACSPTECVCKAVSSLSVGAEKPPLGASRNRAALGVARGAITRRAAPEVPALPSLAELRPAGAAAGPPCKFYWPEADSGISGTVIKNVSIASPDDCCTACSTVGLGLECRAYSISADGATCTLYKNLKPPYIFPQPGTTSAYRSNHPYSPVFGQVGKLNDILDGNWFSTQAPGECQAGQRVGQGCWWRVVAKTAQKNSTCVNGRVSDAVVARRPECFSDCGADAHNASSSCWIDCFFTTLVGDEQRNVTAMTREEIVRPFLQAFASEDPQSGGCPTVPDCPPPCLPPSAP